MPSDRNLLSLDASLATLTRVLCFEVSGLHHRTLVRPVLLTGQTGQTHRSDRSRTAAPPSSVLRSWLCGLLTVNSCIKVRLDLQADKSPVIVKGPFFPWVVNPRYRIRGTNVWCKNWSSNAKKLQSLKGESNASNLKNQHKTNLIY
jgi:hypothetical protein